MIVEERTETPTPGSRHRYPQRLLRLRLANGYIMSIATGGITYSGPRVSPTMPGGPAEAVYDVRFFRGPDDDPTRENLGMVDGFPDEDFVITADTMRDEGYPYTKISKILAYVQRIGLAQGELDNMLRAKLYMLMPDRTSDGIEVVDGLRVWDYNMDVGAVDFSTTREIGSEWFDGWYDVKLDKGGKSFMNGERLRTVHPFNHKPA